MYLLAIAMPSLMRYFGVAALSHQHSGSIFVPFGVNHIAPSEGVEKEQDNSFDCSDWWYEISNGTVDNAPSRALLTKLETDMRYTI